MKTSAKHLGLAVGP